MKIKHTKEELKEIIKECFSKTDLAVKLGYTYVNGKVFKQMDCVIKEAKLDISHFDPRKKNKERRRYKLIEKVWPVCQKTFVTEHGHAKEQTTCSYGCSNTYFRTGSNNGSYRGNSYRTICFEHHEKKCVICDEELIVAVHHYDEDHSNNDPTNLIPLCPTHHKYIHSGYKHLIEEQVEKYRDKWIENNPK